ncbi:Hypothetical predicted protein [Pelobates cultripes]|uniref:Uncharacterized protein n=1 Tax=Pelobates cultripes TaxID=61616 RepID=A0AAD1RTH8_PELCU|nr:Hypothetical predicted protein [Pelobates cultripes]
MGTQLGEPPDTSRIGTRGASKTAQYEEARAIGKKLKSHWEASQAKEMMTIFNLSDKVLTTDHYSLLNKGHSFVPVSKADPFQLEIEMYKTQRVLYWNEIRKDNAPKLTQPIFKKHKKDIRTSNSSIKTFIQTVKVDTDMMMTKPPKYHQNLTLGERKALQDLSQDSSIVIHPVDKGGTTVIQSYQDYRREILRQLDDHTTYTRLTFDPVKKFQTRIKNQIDLGILNGFLDEKMAHPKHPVLYTLPK